MTYQQSVRETAEKMARIIYQNFEENTQSCKEVIISQHIKLAELAISMKAEGFDEGYLFGFDDCEKWINTKCRIARHDKKQQLGLIKPQTNDKD